MKKMIKTCEHCGVATYETHCDVCGKKIDWPIITVSYCYGHARDGVKADICSDECLEEWARNLEKYIDTEEVTVDDIP